MAVGDIIAFEYEWRHVLSGELAAQNTMHYRIEDQRATTDQQWAERIAEELGSLATPLQGSVLAENLRLTQIDFYGITEETVGGSHAVNLTGMVGGDLIPHRSSPVLSKRTGLRGRRFRGRNYLFPVPEPLQAGGVLDADSVRAFNTWGASLLTVTDTTGDEGRLVVHSPGRVTPLPRLEANTPVTSATVNAVLGSQRRRQSSG